MKTKIQQRKLPNNKSKQTETVVGKTSQASLLENKWLPYILIGLFTCIIYGNTLWNKYAIDDTIVINDNKFTLQGFGGITDIMTNDAFVGFFGERGSKLVSGGRYRPLSIVTLAIEVEFFGQNPAISHAINVLLFAFSCMLLYYVLRSIIDSRKGTPFYLTLPFIATLLYAAHPIHTEAVANIKGRDEIMSLLFATLSLAAAIKYVRTHNFLHLLWGAFCLFLGLLSKENAITFIAVIPLTFYFFTAAKPKDYILTIGFYLLPVVGFLIMRNAFTESGIMSDSPEILNNPFAYTKSLTDRYATVIYTFLLYIKLLLFPHPLSHDYYFNQIPIISLTDWGFITSLLVNGALVVYALIKLREKTIPSYAILFYYLTFSIVSNLVFTVGVLMNERFVYMCSIGFCLLLAYWLVYIQKLFQFSRKVLAALVGTIVLLYSIKTISRNRVWVDNMTLFIVDSETCPNSSKVQTSVGGDLTKLAEENFAEAKRTGNLQRYCDLLHMEINTATLADSIIKKKLLELSIQHLNKAIQIYPTHSNAWLLLGNATYKLHKNPQQAIEYYQKSAAYRVGGYYDAWYNMGCVQIENALPADAKVNFLKALEIKPDEFPCRYNLAEAYSRLGDADSAILWYQKTLELKANDGNSLYKIGTIYGKQKGDLNNAIQYLQKAIAANPNVEVYYEDLGVAYGLRKDYDSAIAVSLRCIELFPKYVPAYVNLSISYRNKGDLAKADSYQQKILQLRGQ